MRAHGETSLEAIDIRTRDRRADDAARSGGLFIFIGADAETAWLPPEIALDGAATCSPAPTCAPPGAGSSTATRTCSRRACPGIFACGDVRSSPVKRVAAAVGEGSMAIAFVHQYLREQDPVASAARAQTVATAFRSD